MKTFISALLMVLILSGCSYDDKNIVASQEDIRATQEEVNTKLDYLITLANEPVEIDLTRLEAIVSNFHDMVAYIYKDANIDTAPESELSELEEHEHLRIRYVEYYNFRAEPDAFYDGTYNFTRYLMADSYNDIQDSAIDNLENPAIFHSQGQWRILSEREIDVLRTHATYYDFKTFEWATRGSGMVGIDTYSYDPYHDAIFIGTSRGGDVLSTTTMKDIFFVKRGDFDK